MVDVSPQNHSVFTVVLTPGSVVVEHITRVTTGHTHCRGGGTSLEKQHSNTTEAFCQNRWYNHVSFMYEFAQSELKLQALNIAPEIEEQYNVCNLITCM